MTEREYPRWVHGDGHESVIAETEAEEQTIVGRWADEDAEAAAEADELPNALLPRKAGWPKGKPRKAAQAGMN